MAPGPDAWRPAETRDTNWGAILGDIPQIQGLLSAIFRLIEAHRNEIRALAEAVGKKTPASKYSADMSKHAFLGSHERIKQVQKDYAEKL